MLAFLLLVLLVLFGTIIFFVEPSTFDSIPQVRARNLGAGRAATGHGRAGAGRAQYGACGWWPAYHSLPVESLSAEPAVSCLAVRTDGDGAVAPPLPRAAADG